MLLDENFWDSRYRSNNIGWDIGEISTPLKKYFDQLTDKNLKILIPGGGNSYEAEYLFKLGFRNVYVIDISNTALSNLKQRISDFPKSQLIQANFFDLDDTFDLIIEQTFFCAINPKLRPNYALKTSDLLKPKGKLVGLLFSVPLYEDHPPFGGNKEEYLTYFRPYFEIEIMEPSYNSVFSRKNEELFIKFIKK
ncbi:MAG: methyltransferase domain-containing protein [Bacteroidetes bacterium]|nr:methyltransferase domain-containing protein [Bacteroidota bacterium]